MWRCPNCGEQLGDEFDLCRNCGTAPDETTDARFHAEPNESTVPDFGPEPERQPEVAAGSASEPSDADRQRVVELCSAADVVEARGLCDLLEEGGIPARVVGEYLGGAAGSLPLGEPIAPRIRVHDSDAIRSRELVDQWRKASDTELAEWPETEEPPEWKTATEEEGPLPSDVRFRFLSQGFFILGLACILLGSVQAWQNGRTLSKYSAMTEGQRVNAGFGGGVAIPMPGSPVSSDRRAILPPASDHYALCVRRGPRGLLLPRIADADAAPDRVPIHYEPHAPAEHVVGAVIPAWLVLVFAVGTGAF